MTDLANLTQLVDAYIAKRIDRLLADKAAALLKAEENQLKKNLLEIRAASGAKSLGGTLGTLNWHRKNKPIVENWGALYAYIKQYDAFELLQRRIGEKAVEERWEDGIVIPGVTTFPVDDLTIVGKTK